MLTNKASKQELLTAAMDWLGVEDDEAFLTFRHFRKSKGWQLDPRGGATFCAVAMPTKEKMIFSYALCSDKDVFNKALGREISYGRLTADSHTFEIPFNTAVPISRQIEDFIWSEDLPIAIDEMSIVRHDS
jgi:hypothetical protein